MIGILDAFEASRRQGGFLDALCSSRRWANAPSPALAASNAMTPPVLASAHRANSVAVQV
jgi:hypothetical protein